MARTTAALYDLTPRTVRALGDRRYSRPRAPRQPFVTRLPIEDKRQVEEEAKEQGTTATAIILWAVTEYLALPIAERDANGGER